MRSSFARIGAAAFVVLAGLSATSADEARTYSDEQVSAFVDLLLETAEIENRRVVEVEAAPTGEAALQIHRAAEAKLLRKIETSELPLEVYDEMVVRVRTDPQVAMQVYEELERRGEVAILPEPESAVPVDDSAPTFFAVEDEAGF